MNDVIWEEPSAAPLVPPGMLPAGEDSSEEASLSGSWPVLLTAAEIEVMLCFTLTSPLHYGPIHDRLCDKLRRHLRGQSILRMAAAPEG